jgi:hypothetical protein
MPALGAAELECGDIDAIAGRLGLARVPAQLAHHLGVEGGGEHSDPVADAEDLADLVEAGGLAAQVQLAAPGARGRGQGRDLVGRQRRLPTGLAVGQPRLDVW